jgi:putative CocE/NonD family hydrolase
MAFDTRILFRLLNRLRPNPKVRHTRNIRVPMDDGVTLETEHFAPTAPGPHPTVLTRVPYGIVAFRPMAVHYVEHGFHVVLQACRGTAKSGGTFEPLINERADGLATLRWIKAQPWFDGRLGVSGPSYVGYATWAIADAPEIMALSAKSTSADFKPIVFPGGSFHLGLWLSWIQVMEGLRGSAAVFALKAQFGGVEKKTEEAASQLPLADADIRATGHRVTFWQRWIKDAIGNDAFWEPLDHRHRLGPRTAPNLFVSGWYDFMLDPMLHDYEALVDAGHRPYLTIGPWAHTDLTMLSHGVTETRLWFETHLLGRTGLLRAKPVQIEVSGDWHEFDAWPPRETVDQLWHLHAEKTLAPRAAGRSEPERYLYDPAHPTPNVGGAHFAFSNAGAQNQAALEARADVLTFTSEPLFSDLTVIGQPLVTLFCRSSLPNADFFVKLCDVDENGVSIGISDGIIRMTPAAPAVTDDIWRLQFRLHGMGHKFERGHRLRVQVSSGAHPRFARNTGTDEPLGEAVRLVAADMEIFHDPARPSAIALPVWMG